jgi:hypothetical protein
MKRKLKIITGFSLMFSPIAACYIAAIIDKGLVFALISVGISIAIVGVIFLGVWLAMGD